ncbi:SOS response-associated peptidase [Novipirellula galeiformis]|nr:SOS response-associated peptidase [Novipirellula galeiformis]
MCGRFTLRASLADLRQMFLPDVDPQDFTLPTDPPRYNIAPTQSVAVIRQSNAGDRREGTAMRWGLVPSWADDLTVGARMINARCETIDEKRSFRNAFQQQRCLIPADGYFEWQKRAAAKQPYLIHRPDNGVFAMAGVWESNSKIANGSEPILSFSVITTPANQVTGKIHDRMPVIIDPSDFDRWLDPNHRDTPSLKKQLAAAPSDFFVTTPVSRHVNHVRNDDPECVRPIDLKAFPPPATRRPQATQTTMFDD